MPNSRANSIADVTQLLAAMGSGDPAAANELFPLVYRELRALAGSLFRQQRSDHTLQPTALVHDAYLRLVDQTNPQFSGRAHFFAVAAKAMRQILTDHARRKAALKRGGAHQQISLDRAVAESPQSAIDILALDEALTRLTALDDRKCRVVELRFFGGLTNEAVAEVLGVSRATVVEDWTVARAWLRSQLGAGAQA
jgi:RNA polymerase sigma factor (TIGR02999 family)